MGRRKPAVRNARSTRKEVPKNVNDDKNTERHKENEANKQNVNSNATISETSDGKKNNEKPHEENLSQTSVASEKSTEDGELRSVELEIHARDEQLDSEDGLESETKKRRQGKSGETPKGKRARMDSNLEVNQRIAEQMEKLSRELAEVKQQLQEKEKEQSEERAHTKSRGTRESGMI